MRGKAAKPRVLKLDTIYKSSKVTRLINKVMQHGKKTIAERLVYTAMEDAAKKSGKSPLETLEKALTNVTPPVEVRSRRVGGANYQVPVPVTERRQEALAVRWIVDACRARKGIGFAEILAEEILNAYNSTGSAMKKKEDVLRMAEASKAFSHFAW